MTDLIQQQRLLLHGGIETTAEVMDASFFDEQIGNKFPAQLWIRLKKMDGSFIYTHTQTLLSINHVPAKGETVRVRYFPENLSAILIL